MDRVGGYHAGLLSEILHDHHLKAIAKTPPVVQILSNIPGMGQVLLEAGQPQGGKGDAATAPEQ